MSLCHADNNVEADDLCLNIPGLAETGPGRFCKDSLHVLLLYSKVLAEIQLVLRVINRDSMLTEPERDRVGPGFEITGGVTPPSPLICAPAGTKVFCLP